jgi:hypothetical protein
MRATTEAVVKLFARAYRERGGFLTVKRAAGNMIRAGFFERHMALDHANNIHSIEQIPDETLCDHDGRIEGDAIGICAKRRRAQ